MSTKQDCRKGQKIKNCAGKESFERMNYLYQISCLYAGDVNTTMATFSKHCSNLMVNISRKTVLRMEPKLKRKICKVCKSVLVQRKTSKVKITKKKVRWTCNTCQTVKEFSTRKEHACWLEKSESILELIDYRKNTCDPLNNLSANKEQQSKLEKLEMSLNQIENKNT